MLMDEAARRFPVFTSIIAEFKFGKRKSFYDFLRNSDSTHSVLAPPSQINVLAFVKNARLRGEGITW